MATELTFTPKLDEEDFIFVCDQTGDESSFGEYADEGDDSSSVPAILKIGNAIYYLDIPDANAEPLPSVMCVEQVSEMTTNPEEDAEIAIGEEGEEDEEGDDLPADEEEEDEEVVVD